MADPQDGIDRRHALECMVWAGTGVLWTGSGGVPRSLNLLGDAEAAETRASALTFLQISDSHIGFNKPANPNALGTLQEAIDTSHTWRRSFAAATQSACFEAGRGILPKTAPWMADYETELLGFPLAKFDDQVDSTTQFLEWAQERHEYQPIIVGPITGRQIRPQWMQDIG